MSSFQHFINKDYSIFYAMGEQRYYLYKHSDHTTQTLICVGKLTHNPTTKPVKELKELFENDYYIVRKNEHYWFKKEYDL